MNWRDAASKSPRRFAIRLMDIDTGLWLVRSYTGYGEVVSADKKHRIRDATPQEMEGFLDWEPLTDHE